MPTKLIVDCSTGVTTEVELTDEEVAQREASAAAFAAEQAEREAAEAAKAVFTIHPRGNQYGWSNNA